MPWTPMFTASAGAPIWGRWPRWGLRKLSLPSWGQRTTSLFETTHEDVRGNRQKDRRCRVHLARRKHMIRHCGPRGRKIYTEEVSKRTSRQGLPPTTSLCSWNIPGPSRAGIMRSPSPAGVACSERPFALYQMPIRRSSVVDYRDTFFVARFGNLTQHLTPSLPAARQILTENIPVPKALAIGTGLLLLHLQARRRASEEQ